MTQWRSNCGIALRSSGSNPCFLHTLKSPRKFQSLPLQLAIGEGTEVPTTNVLKPWNWRVWPLWNPILSQQVPANHGTCHQQAINWYYFILLRVFLKHKLHGSRNSQHSQIGFGNGVEHRAWRMALFLAGFSNDSHEKIEKSNSRCILFRLNGCLFRLNSFPTKIWQHRLTMSKLPSWSF